MNIIMNIDKTGPLNGNGFFEITRGTLTCMMSVGITYVKVIFLNQIFGYTKLCFKFCSTGERF
jgi:hypothetical protein